MPSSVPRRRAERPPSRLARSLGRARGLGTGPTPALAAVLALVLAGTGALVAALVSAGPPWLPGVGAVAVACGYSWALAARTGGRPVVVGTLALVMGVGVLVVDDARLRTGAAVLTCVVSAVLAVMATVPARRFRHVVREVGVALVLAGIGALATVGFAPTITLARFEYTTLGLALLGAFGVVHRLGAGLHGLGRRGVIAVLAGSLLLAVTLAYAELLRRYGPPGLVAGLLDAVHWSRDHLLAFPRPIEAVLGVPALAWGCHMRARRRQGWWVCAFGAAASAPGAQALLNPRIGVLESGLSLVYGALVGLLLGFLLIRADLRLTGPRGRRARRAEEAAAGRPEPGRTQALM